MVGCDVVIVKPHFLVTDVPSLPCSFHGPFRINLSQHLTQIILFKNKINDFVYNISHII